MEMPALDPNQRRILERLRAICLALPDAREEMKWGHPNWTVGGKIFAAFGFYGGGPSLATKQTLARQAQLIDDPERFFPSPYVGQHGWTSMRLEGEIAWNVVESLVKTSHGHVTSSPKSKASAAAKSSGSADGAARKPSAKKKAADADAKIVAVEPMRAERAGPTKKTKTAADEAAVLKPTAKPTANAKGSSKSTAARSAADTAEASGTAKPKSPAARKR